MHIERYGERYVIYKHILGCKRYFAEGTHWQPNVTKATTFETPIGAYKVIQKKELGYTKLLVWVTVFWLIVSVTLAAESIWNLLSCRQ